jgi:hypothetical protein
MPGITDPNISLSNINKFISINLSYLYTDYYLNNILKLVKIGSFVLLLLVVTLITGTGCATDKKARQIVKRAANSSCDLSHLGRNKYFYSPHYKKRLSINVRNIDRRK